MLSCSRYVSCANTSLNFFAKEMKLELEKDGEKLPIQIWSTDITREVYDAILVGFDRYFSSKMIILLTINNPRITYPLLELIRPKDHIRD